MIELGDTVKCRYTGFKGVAVHRTTFVNGCVQFGIAPRVGRDGKYIEETEIDEESLEIVKKARKPKPKEKVIPFSLPGGRSKPASKMRGF